MAEPSQGPFAKIALALFGLSLIGLVLVFPYALSLEAKGLAAAAAHAHMPLWNLLAFSFVQSALLLGAASFAGLWAARKLDLRTPLFSALFLRTRAPRSAFATLLLAVALGAAVGAALIVVDRYVFAPIPSVAKLIHAAAGAPAHPLRWQGFLAAFYGGIDEEILMRLGLLSLLALGLRGIAWLSGARSDVALSAGVFWTANLLAALIFGLGHLPATAAIAPLSAAVAVRAIVLNGGAGIVFGALYRSFGLEWAMASHFGSDFVLHVVLGS